MKNIKARLRDDQGLTLVELLIGIAITGIIIVAVSGMFISASRSYHYSFEQSANTQTGRQIIAAISKEIRNATGITAPANGIAQNSITYQKSGSVVQTICIGTGTNANTIVFLDSSGKVIHSYGKGRIQSLLFDRGIDKADLSDSQKRITITLKIQKSVNVKAPRSELSTTVYMLN